MDQYKILFVINSLARNGAESVLIKLLKYLPEIDPQLKMHLYVLEEVDNPLEIPAHVRTYSGGKSNFSNTLKLSKIFTHAFQVKKIIKENNFRTVISFLSRANYVNLLAGILDSGHHAIISERNIPSILYNSNRLTDIINRMLKRFLYPSARRIIAISGGVKEDLVENFKIDAASISVIYNPIDLTDIKLKMRAELENKWLKDDAVKTIITVGRLERPKNQTLLLHAFKNVVRQIPQSRLLLIGEGILKDELKGLSEHLGISDKIEFAGYRSNPYAYLARADLFVLSSDTEGFGNVIIEAMACGCPVISTNCPSGPGEIIVSGKDGILTEPDNIEALSDAMLDLLKDEGLRKAIIENAHKRVIDFNIGKIAGQYYEEIYACK